MYKFKVGDKVELLESGYDLEYGSFQKGQIGIVLCRVLDYITIRFNDGVLCIKSDKAKKVYLTTNTTKGNKMTKEHFLEKYAQPETVVWCKTKELSDEFLGLCEKFGLKFNKKMWENYKEETCYNLNEGGAIFYGSRESEVGYEAKGKIIIEFEPQKEQYTVQNMLSRKELADAKHMLTTHGLSLEEAFVKMINYFEQSNVEKVFEMLGVKPNEEFILERNEINAMPLARNFFFDESLKLCCVGKGFTYKIYLGDILSGEYEIIKLPPKPLLTDEEKEFLKNFEFEKARLLDKDFLDLYIAGGRVCHQLHVAHLKVDLTKLVRGVLYTREELGL